METPPDLKTEPLGARLGSGQAQLPLAHAQRQGTCLHSGNAPVHTLLVLGGALLTPMSTLLVAGGGARAPVLTLLVAGGVNRAPLQHESHLGRLQQNLLCEADIIHVVQCQSSACIQSKGPGPLMADCLHKHGDRNDFDRSRAVPE